MEPRSTPSDPTQSGMLGQLMDHISDNIYFMDREGRIVLISQWGAKWLGFESPEQVIGKTDFDLFSEEHAAAAFADEQRIMESGEPITGIEEKETWPDGRVTWVSTTKMPLRDEHGKIIGIFGISRDITAHKQRELLVGRMQEQMESELARAGEVQRSLLADSHFTYPREATPGTGSVEIRHNYQPSGPVGGDFFCFLPLAETRIGIFIADVMGHGVGAALTMSALNAMVQSEAARLSKPDAFLERLNRRLREVISNEEVFEFITAFYLVIDTTSGELNFATAGHHSPLLQTAGEQRPERLFERKDLKGPALMLTPEPSFSTGQGQLNSGDRILLFTDGLTEMPTSTNHDQDIGLDGLIDTLAHIPSPTIEDLVERLPPAILDLSGASAFKDDLCLIGLEFQLTQTDQTPKD